MNLNEHFRAITRAYSVVMPEWLEDYEATGNMWHDPYVMDWDFTPIERHVWSDLRDMALPFYPQIPACGYFLDFANPFLKIGIECDGKAWHDAERDRVRDARLAAAGWTIYRIEGHECFRQVDLHVEFDDEPARGDVHRHYESTSTGILQAIKWAHFGGQVRDDAEWLMGATLFNHRSTPDMVPPAREVRRRSEPVLIGELMAGYLETLARRVERSRGGFT